MFEVADGWMIDADDSCFRVGKMESYTEKKSGNVIEKFSPKFYYTDFEGALRGVYRQIERSELKDAKSLTEAIETVGRVREEFEGVLRREVRPWTAKAQ